jgi:fibronectin type 3 domain-containing protein
MRKLLSVFLVILLLLAMAVPAMAVEQGETSGQCGESMNWSFDTTSATLTISGTGDMYAVAADKEAFDSGVYAFEPGWWSLPVKHVVVQEGVENLSNYAFAQVGNQEYLETVELPTTLKAIPEYGFIDAPNMKSLRIPEGITAITGWPFGNPKKSMLSLTEIYLPVSLKQYDAVTLYAAATDVKNNVQTLKTIHYAGTQAQWAQVQSVQSATMKSLMGYNDAGYAQIQERIDAITVKFAGDQNDEFEIPFDELLFVAQVKELSAQPVSYNVGQKPTNLVITVTYKDGTTGVLPQSIRVSYPTEWPQEPGAHKVEVLVANKYTVPVDVTVLPSQETEHSYVSVVTDPTCTAEGYTTHTCSGCGNSYVDTYVAALGHSWDAGVVTKEPTEQETGVRTHTCKTCEETKTETIPVLEHVHDYTTTVVEPTLTDKGYTEYTCACGDSYRADYTDALTLTAPQISVTVDPVTGKQTLTWTGGGSGISYEVYRATSKSGKYTKLVTVEDNTWVDDSASVGKTYYYKVRAVYEADTSVVSGYSNIVSAAAKCAAVDLTVNTGSTGKPVLSWNKISGAKKYEIHRSVNGGTFKKLTTTTKTTYTDTKATAGAECTYKVKALGSSSKYNGGFGETGSCYVTLAAPALTAKVDTASGKPTLSWKKVTGAAGYAIYRSVNGGEYQLLTTVTGVSYKDTATSADNQYSYYVITLGKAEVFNSAASATKTVTVAVGQPKLSGTVNANGKPVISWTAVDDAVSYKVYRATSSSSSKFKTPIVTVTDTTYVDETVAAGKTYYYKVVAVGANSESVMSAYVKLTGKCAAPEISVEVNAESGKPVLSWEKITGAKKYTVYRATSENGKYKSLGTTTKLTYTDKKATAGTTYYYKVIANASSSKGNSGYSNIVSCSANCSTPVVKVTVTASTGKPTISWGKVSGATQYVVMYVDVTDFMESETGPDETYLEKHMQYVTTQKTSVTLTDTEAGCVYMVTVTAVPKNEACFSAPSEPQFVASACAAPKITGFISDEYGKPGAYWNEVDGAEGYIVYRSTKSGSGYEPLDIVYGDYFIDGSAVKGKTYYYKVTAVAAYSESSLSNSVKLKSK